MSQEKTNILFNPEWIRACGDVMNELCLNVTRFKTIMTPYVKTFS